MIEGLYEKNGLVFWTEQDIKVRCMVEGLVIEALAEYLQGRNRAFQFVQCEAPQLTPVNLIHPGYTGEDIYLLGDVALRPETTMGSYAYAQELLNPHRSNRRLPLVVWQHGKSFRREQDQATKYMRLKEFYQLEFQILYPESTATDYAPGVLEATKAALEVFVGACRTEQSDRLPDYSAGTTDIVCIKHEMEVCSVSKRQDYPGARCLEVAIGTDRCVALFNRR